mmetsp:Transcript_8887/g.21257  ORF Transcript_8887/g.21257 Transcript_8887/m.21257 type:complete len:448 (-) Transcript_8887:1994-3337(-)
MCRSPDFVINTPQTGNAHRFLRLHVAHHLRAAARRFARHGVLGHDVHAVGDLKLGSLCEAVARVPVQDGNPASWLLNPAALSGSVLVVVEVVQDDFHQVHHCPFGQLGHERRGEADVLPHSRTLVDDHVGARGIRLSLAGVLPSLGPAVACVRIEEGQPASALCHLAHQTAQPIPSNVVQCPHNLDFVVLCQPRDKVRVQVSHLSNVTAVGRGDDVGAGTQIPNVVRREQRLLLLLHPDPLLPVALELLVLDSPHTIPDVIHSHKNAGDRFPQKGGLAPDRVVNCPDLSELEDLLHLSRSDAAEDLAESLLRDSLRLAVIDAGQQIEGCIPAGHVPEHDKMPANGRPECILLGDASPDLAVAIEDDSKHDVDHHQAHHDDHAPNPDGRRPPVLLGNDVPVRLEGHHLFEGLGESTLDCREVAQFGAEKDVPGNHKSAEDEEEYHEQM